MGDVRELQEKIEAAPADLDLRAIDQGRALFSDSLTRAIFGHQWTLNDWGLVRDALSGSLDGCLALHKRVLPGWIPTIYFEGACVDLEYAPDGSVIQEVEGKNPDPARAWLIAILRALSEVRQ